MIQITHQNDTINIELTRDRADILISREIGVAISNVMETVSNKTIYLDFNRVEYIDSSFIGVLIQIHRDSLKKQNTVIFKNVNDTIRSLFELTKLSSIFRLE